MKKIIHLLFLCLISIFVFFCIEYVVYKFFILHNPLYIVTFILFLVVFYLDIHLLNKMNFPNKIISPAIALITVFLGLALLKFLLPILK